MNGASEQQWQERITIDEAVLAGKPVIRGTRIAVEQVLDSLVSTVDARLTPHQTRLDGPTPMIYTVVSWPDQLNG